MRATVIPGTVVPSTVIPGADDVQRMTGPAHPTAVLAIICVSYFMVILDNSIIFTGLPRIQEAMHFTPTGLTWVQDAYTLVFGGLLLLGARAGDIVGRRRMFTVGLVLFAGASLLVGAAPTASWLVLARGLQGVGAAILAPSSLALLTASFPEGHQRSRAVAAYSAVAGIGASLGLVVGALQPPSTASMVPKTSAPVPSVAHSAPARSKRPGTGGVSTT